MFHNHLWYSFGKEYDVTFFLNLIQLNIGDILALYWKNLNRNLKIWKCSYCKGDGKCQVQRHFLVLRR